MMNLDKKREELKMKRKVKVVGATLLIMTALSSASVFADTMGERGPNRMPQQGNLDFMDTYVETGVLTQTELEAIESYLVEKNEDRQANAPDLESMTEAERLALKESMGDRSANLLDELVDEGLLTTEQAAQITVEPKQVDGKDLNRTEKVKEEVDGISVTLNGQEVKSDVRAYVDGNSRTMIELRSVAEALGAEIGWDGETQTVSLTLDDETIDIQIGQKKYSLNGSRKDMDTEAVIVDGRTMIPVRVVAEALGAEVGWNAETKTVELTN